MRNYRPARLVRGSDRWYILFYQTDPLDDKIKRHRETFELNRIEDPAEREKQANYLIHRLNSYLLPAGYPYEKKMMRGENCKTVREGIEKALAIHKANLRPASFKDYKNKSSIFLRWWESSEFKSVLLRHMTTRHMLEYMDYLMIEKNVSAVTYNNHKRTLSAIFSILVEREYLDINPLQGIKKKKQSKKRRRPLSVFEQKTIFSASDDVLKFAIIMTYSLGIRPAEIRRLKRSHIDLENKIIQMPGSITKNKQDSIVIIPESIYKVFCRLVPKCLPNYYVIGEKLEPAANMCGVNSIAEKHRILVHQLKNEGRLEDISGISYYSWKDTGAIELAKQISVVALMHHYRHQDLSATQKYVNHIMSFTSEVEKSKFSLLETDSSSL